MTPTVPPSDGAGGAVEQVRARAALVRRETIRLVGIAKSGHYTSVFSCAEILAALYSGLLRIDNDPEWPERDRLVLSKGHAAVGLYPLLAERGYLPAQWLREYTRLGSPLGDHPDMRRVPGVDFSSGSIGHGLSIGVGMALAARLSGLEETRAWVLLGDQELNEGQVWEAAQTASHLQLGNVCAIVDRNEMGLDGMTEEVMAVDPIDEKFHAFGWRVVMVDGHNPEALLGVLGALPRQERAAPTCVIARTVKGKGLSFMELSRTWHLGYLAPADAERALEELAGDA
ncbi:MAG TPA: transketolase [Solirubrobacterales bacterium]|nr:transketolase [Solirubrobacterales bacterium]